MNTNVYILDSKRILKENNDVISFFINPYKHYDFLEYELDMLLNSMEIKINDKHDDIIIVRLEKEEGNYILKEQMPQKTLSHFWSIYERNSLFKGLEVTCDDFYDPKTCSYFKAVALWDKEKREIKLERV